jgi:hypothetical protein
MLSRFFSWYTATPLFWRRIIVAALVPVSEYLCLETTRRALNGIMKVNRNLAAILSVPVLLIACGLTVAAIGLYVHECYVAIGPRIKSKAAGYLALACIFAWVILPIHIMTHMPD